MKGGLEGFPMMLVGNKCDEEAGRQKKEEASRKEAMIFKKNPDRTL